MSQPVTINIVRRRGDTYAFDLVVGANLSGYTISLAVDSLEVPAVPSVTNIFTLTGTIAAIARNRDTGIIETRLRFALSSPQADRAPVTLYYDAKATLGDTVRTFATGTWVVEG